MVTHLPPAPDRSVLIITGMHRSGTSLGASIAQAMGVNIGSRLMGAHDTNPMGHYEDLDFVRFHEHVLIANHVASEGYGAWFRNLSLASAHVQDARDLVSHRSSQYHYWGWKDPRTILFLDDWIQLIPDARFLFLFRDPAQVVRSLIERGEPRFQDDGDMALREWYSYNRRIRDFLSVFPGCSMLQNTSTLDRDYHIFLDRLQALTGLRDCGNSSPVVPGLLKSSGHLPRARLAQELIRRCYELYDELCRLADSRCFQADHPLPPPAPTRAAVVVPMHRLPLAAHEVVSLAQLEYCLPHYDLIVLKPHSLDASCYRHASVSFDDRWFQSVSTYSDLMLTTQFYDAFDDYEYILIHQLDALVTSEALGEWCERGWDYVGAPWLNQFSALPSRGIWRAGNGGFSLRKPGRLRSLLATEAAQARLRQVSYYEDLFWSFDAPLIDSTFTIPSADEACSFAAETAPRHIFKLLGNRLPFGCHYWHKVDPAFWVQHLAPNARELLESRYRTVLDNPSHPDHRWMRRWTSQIMACFLDDFAAESLVGFLLAGISDELLDSVPTASGMHLVFDRILQRDPTAEWLDFWVGRDDTTLRQIVTDLVRGPEFAQRIQKLTLAAKELSDGVAFAPAPLLQSDGPLP